jgi:hypothetical protein
MSYRPNPVGAFLKSLAISSKCQLVQSHTAGPALIPLLLAILLIVPSCDKENYVWNPTPGLSGYVKLQNQSDHSGVLVRVTETERTAVTNSRGYFSFDDVPDGTWRLEAEYPYFETDSLSIDIVDGLQQRPVRMVLGQELQFWVGPADTVVSMTHPGGGDFFLVLSGYVKNVSDSPVTVLGISGCDPRLFAIRSVQPDMTAECEAQYGWLEPSDCLPVFELTFDPGETKYIPLVKELDRSCFDPGRYEVSWVLNDNGNHAPHFEPGSDLNKSLIAKTELLRPAAVNLVP